MKVPRFLLIFDYTALMRLLLIAAMTILFLVVSACSNTHETESSPSVSGINTTKKVAKGNYVEHIHPENICFGARSHSHAGGEKEHEHSSNCIQSKSGTSNAHIHPKDSKGRVIKHVHPNGSSEHTHL